MDLMGKKTSPEKTPRPADHIENDHHQSHKAKLRKTLGNIQIERHFGFGERLQHGNTALAQRIEKQM